MFTGLATEIDEVTVPAIGDAIAEARRLRDLLDAKISIAEAEYAARGIWQVDGFGSMAAFERHRCRLSDTEAKRIALRAARLRVWPELAKAWTAGVVTGTQVDAAVALVPDRQIERFARSAAENALILSPLSAQDSRAVLRHWVSNADALAEREAAEAGIEALPEPPERELFVSRSLNDSAVVNGNLDKDSAVFVDKALRAAARPDLEGERRTPAERRADALVEVCRGYLAALDDPDGRRATERLTIVAEISALYRAALRGAGVRTAAQLEAFLAARSHLGALERGLFLDGFDGGGGVAHALDGNPISDGLLSRVSAGGVLELLLTADGRILHLGRSVRTFTAAQRRAILTRDGGCRDPGCDKGPEHCDAHHVVPWEEGGLTDITNGVAKCRHGHLEHHRHGWSDSLDLDGTYTVTTPSGVAHATRPPGWQLQPVLPVATTARSAPELAFNLSPAPGPAPSPPPSPSPWAVTSSGEPPPSGTVQPVPTPRPSEPPRAKPTGGAEPTVGAKPSGGAEPTGEAEPSDDTSSTAGPSSSGRHPGQPPADDDPSSGDPVESLEACFVAFLLDHGSMGFAA